MARSRSKKIVLTGAELSAAAAESKQNLVKAKADAKDALKAMQKVMAKKSATEQEIETAKANRLAAREAVKVAKAAVVKMPRGRPTADTMYSPEERAKIVDLVRNYTLSGAVAILRAKGKSKQSALRPSCFSKALTISTATVRKFVSMDPNPPALKRGFGGHLHTKAG